MTDDASSLFGNNDAQKELHRMRMQESRIDKFQSCPALSGVSIKKMCIGESCQGYRVDVERRQGYNGNLRTPVYLRAGQFNCNVEPVFSRRRALENSCQWPCLSCWSESQCMSSCVALLSPEVEME